MAQIFEGQIRVGIQSGQQHTDFESYLGMWRKAEELGMDWASVFDHFVPIFSDPEGPCFDGYTLLAAMAAHTSSIRCGILVTGVTYRHPAVLANMAATIDHISGGRLEMGIGAAWWQLEHDQYGIRFPPVSERMNMLDEACRILRSMWTEQRTSFAGAHWTLTDALCEPKPVQHHLPLWIGGIGERRTLRIVAQHADGWNTFLTNEPQYSHLLDVLAKHCADVGRDPADIRKQLICGVILGENERELDDRVGERADAIGVGADAIRERFTVTTADRFVEMLRPYARMGVGDFLLLARPPVDERTMELLATHVAPAMRR